MANPYRELAKIESSTEFEDNFIVDIATYPRYLNFESDYAEFILSRPNVYDVEVTPSGCSSIDWHYLFPNSFEPFVTISLEGKVLIPREYIMRYVACFNGGKINIKYKVKQ